MYVASYGVAIILGCDLSYTRSGLVWISDTPSMQSHGSSITVLDHMTITIKPGPLRLLRAARAFHKALKTHPCDLAVIEDVAIGAPSRFVVMKLAALSTICELMLECHGVAYLKVSPTAIKKWMTGKGTSEKHVVAQELKRRWNIEFADDKGNDLSDAAACAVWGASR